MATIFRRFYPVTANIDGEPVLLRIRRLTSAEFREYETAFFGFKRQQDEAPAPETEEARQAAARREAEGEAFVEQSITRYVSVQPGELVVEDEQGARVPIETGADLLREFRHKKGFLPYLLSLIWGENSLSGAEKNVYRSRLASALSSRNSSEPDPMADGPEPAPTAAPAGPEATTADAAAASPSTPSEDASSSTPATS